MNKKILIIFILFFAGYGTKVFSFQCLDFEGIRQELEECEKLFEKNRSPKEQAYLHYHLAKAFFFDQELEQAFIHFIKALEIHPIERKYPLLSEEEKNVYEQAFLLYLAGIGKDPMMGSKKLLEEFETIQHDHPGYLHLEFLLSTAYANLEKYDLFFERFFSGYPYFADTYLAYKTKGILHLKLSQLSSNESIRKESKQAAKRELEQALVKNPQDSSLYKILLFLAKEKKEEENMLSYLQQILLYEVAIPRGDIFFYVQESIALEQFQLAQQLIDLTKKYYPYSRAIALAQELLDKHR